MGVNSIWETIGDGEVVSIAELAANHFQKHGKPLRIAVDEASWRYKNVTHEQTLGIRQSSGRLSHPLEKDILWRTCRYRALGIQLIFVFDGQRPSKRGKPARKGQDGHTKLLRETLSRIGVPCWNAPGEAEAECASLQEQGLVDAVFSEDSDTLMFGSGVLYRFSRENDGKTKSKTHVRVLCVDEIKRRVPYLDRHGMILFAVLVGADYAVKGLPGCGPITALKAVQKSYGDWLVNALHKGQLRQWRSALSKHFEQTGARIQIPEAFPDPEILKLYVKPLTTSAEGLNEFKTGTIWDSNVDQESLLHFLPMHYNFDACEFIRWIVPVLLVGALQSSHPGLGDLAIKKEKSLSGKDFGGVSASKISFLIDPISRQELLIQWPKKDTKQVSRVKPYVHVARVECDVLDYLLESAVPDVLASYNPSKDPFKRRGRPPKETPDGISTMSVTDNSSPNILSPNASTPDTSTKKRGRPRKKMESPSVDSSFGTVESTNVSTHGSAKKRGRPRNDTGNEVMDRGPSKSLKPSDKLISPLQGSFDSSNRTPVFRVPREVPKGYGQSTYREETKNFIDLTDD